MCQAGSCGHRAEPAAPAGDNDVTKGSKCHSTPPTGSPVVASRGPRRRSPASSPAVPAAPTTAAAPTAPADDRLLASWSPRRTTPTTTTRRWPPKYTDETGVEIEVIPYPSDAYNTQVTTQLQAGNAADMMILAPGTGQADLGRHPRRRRLPRAARRHLGRRHPRGHASRSTRSTARSTASPPRSAPVGLVYNVAGGRRGRRRRVPRDLRRPAEGVHHGARRRQELHRRSPVGIPFNTGLFSQLISATRVYEETPTGTSSAPPVTSPSPTAAGSESLEDIVEMNDSGCFQDGVAGGTFDSITQGIGGGTSLTRGRPRLRGDLDQRRRRVSDLTVQAFPPADGRRAFMLASANYAWAINAAADDAVKASAQDFLDWVAEPEQAQGVRRPLRHRADHRHRAPMNCPPSTSRSATCSRRRLHRPAERDLAQPRGLRRPRRRRPGPADRSEDGRPDARRDGCGLGRVDPLTQRADRRPETPVSGLRSVPSTERNPRWPDANRIRSLLAQMTPAEKLGQLQIVFRPRLGDAADTRARRASARCSGRSRRRRRTRCSAKRSRTRGSASRS